MNIKNACIFLGVPRSGFYASLHETPSKHTVEDAFLKDRIKDIFLEHKHRYETRRIKALLKRKGLNVSRRRIGRLLREQGLYTKGVRRKYIHYTKNITYISGSILNQNIKKKNTVWYGDITYIPTEEGILMVTQLWSHSLKVLNAKFFTSILSKQKQKLFLKRSII